MVVEAVPVKKDSVDVCEYKYTHHLTHLTPVLIADTTTLGGGIYTTTPFSRSPVIHILTQNACR